MGVKFAGKLLLIAFFCICAAPSLAPAESSEGGEDAAYDADADVKGLWLVSQAFPDDAETARFMEGDDGGVLYARVLEGGLRFTIDRSLTGETSEPYEMRKNMEKRVADEGGDPDEIQFDMAAEEFADILGVPCMLAAYKTGGDDDERTIVNLCVFTDRHTFVVSVEAPTDVLIEKDRDMEKWLLSLKFVNGVARGGYAAAGPVAIACTQEDFAGDMWKIDELGEFDLEDGFDLPNDSIRSIRVMPGCEVTIYEHAEFGGETVSFTADSGSLGEWNSRASSLTVTRLDEKARPEDVEDWLESAGYAEVAAGEDGLPMVVSGRVKHGARIGWYKSAGEFVWYGEASDDGRVRMAGELLEIFSDCGIETDEWTPGSLARQIDSYYGRGRSSDIWNAAVVTMNADPDLFD